MKLYIKQKVFSFVSRFTVKDENENDKYRVEGEFFSFGRRLHVYDRAEREVALIKQRLWTVLPKYEVYVGGELRAVIAKRWTFFKMNLSVDMLGWTVQGDIWNHSYEITAGRQPVARIDKEWFTWGDSYVLEVYRPEDENCALAVMLAIDCIMEQDAQN